MRIGIFSLLRVSLLLDRRLFSTERRIYRSHSPIYRLHDRSNLSWLILNKLWLIVDLRASKWLISRWRHLCIVYKIINRRDEVSWLRSYSPRLSEPWISTHLWFIFSGVSKRIDPWISIVSIARVNSRIIVCLLLSSIYRC
mgnify:CR=1 FL=1